MSRVIFGNITFLLLSFPITFYILQVKHQTILYLVSHWYNTSYIDMMIMA